MHWPLFSKDGHLDSPRGAALAASLVERLTHGWRMLEWRHVAARVGRCPICGPAVFVRLNRTDWGVRCARCGGAPNTLLLVESIQTLIGDLLNKQVYVLSAAGPLFEYLRRNCRHLTHSLYSDAVEPGGYVGGVLSQDVQRLTFADESFDLCIHSEVFEHVPDDRAGFREVHRVLKQGGATLFTVPVFDRDTTLERARIANGHIEHLQPPEYHNDQLRGSVLAFRDYGRDVIDRLTAAGFTGVRLISAPGPAGLKYVRPGFDRPLIVGYKRRPTSPGD
jgi:SAM-dependent methyltransferase